MKTKFLRLIALTLCVLMLMSSLLSLTALAEESAASDSEESEDVDIWETLKPAYMATAYTSITDRMKGDDVIAPMECFCVIDGYAFYGDRLTGEMVFLKLTDPTLTKEAIDESGEIPEYTAYYSTNPYNIGSASALGSTQSTAATEKEKLYSQIIIKYSENDKDSEMNSFASAAVNDQITVKNIRNGVRVEYTIGREEVKYLVPRLIRAEKFLALKEQIATNSTSKRDAEVFNAFYQEKDLDKASTTKSREEMKAAYPITEQFPVYVCEPIISTQELLRLERLVKSYTDYDYETLDADHAETDYVAADKVPPLFKMALEYKVDGDEITIRCKAGNIRFDSSVYKLSDVIILPYGGAGDCNNSGYIFSPDGSGSLLDFSDFSSSFTYSTSLYGQDYVYHTITGAHMEVARLPVYGVYQKVENNSTALEEVPVLDENGEQTYDEEGNPVTELVEVSVPLEIAYLAVIESGASLASVNIMYGGALHMYASVYTSFNPRPKDSYILDGGISAGTNAMWTVESKRKYTGDYTIRLFILDGTEDGDVAPGIGDADKSYSDMAAAYREYLTGTGVLTPVEDTKDDIPLYIETLGAILTNREILGIPYETAVAMTSFQDDIDMLTLLKGEYDIDNVKLILSGWCNDGLIPYVPNDIDIEKALGGEEGFKALIEYCKANNIDLFPELEFAIAYRDLSFDGFDQDEDLSQTIDDRSAIMKEYDPVWQGFIRSGMGVISPSYMKKLYANASEEYNQYNVGGIAVPSLGQYLSSDFNTDNPLTREDSRILVTQLLEAIDGHNDKVLIAGGNDYALPYATDLIDVPLDDSRYKYSYASIPFMSMVLHGSKQYTGTALNLAGDLDYQVLKTIESGASPYFVVAVNNTSELKQYTYSSVSQYYSVRYSIWLADIIVTYRQINEALCDVQDSYILKHDILSSDGNVVKVTYANGISFYINYNITDYVVNDGGVEYELPAEGFVKVSADGTIVMKGDSD